MSRPLIIGGTASGVGKTTLATGLMGAFRSRGLRVAPFKAGPDYIDPGFHEAAAGTPSRNLDTWLTSPDTVRAIYARAAATADVAVVEGVMGLFDGRAGAGDQGSTAEIAGLIGAAVILVVDCQRLARSLAPVLAGFKLFDRRLDLAGAVLNNVGSAGHERMLLGAAAEAGVPVLGVLPRRQDIELPSRHLGLVPAQEQEGRRESLARIVDHVSENVDLDALLAVAGAVSNAPDAGALGVAAGGRPQEEPEAIKGAVRSAQITGGSRQRVRIAVARDEAFSFYYVDSLEALAAAGASLEFFSPLRDERLPDCDGLYLGGGFPEMHAGELEANSSMRASVASAVLGGLPVYAECGGLVYLCEGVEVSGRRHTMTGAIPLSARMTDRRQALGYVEARAKRDSILLDAGQSVRGHEFHWSTVEWDAGKLAWDVSASREPGIREEGFCAGNVLASFVHLHFAGSPVAAAGLIRACGGSREVSADAVL